MSGPRKLFYFLLVNVLVALLLLHRALGSVGLRESDVRLKDTSDAVIDMAFAMTDMQAIASPPGIRSSTW